MAVFVEVPTRTRPARRKAAEQGCAHPGPVDFGRAAEPRWFERALRRRAPGRATACRPGRDGEWIWLGAAAAFTFLFVMLVGLVGPATGGSVPTTTAVVQVRAGDTLWSLAGRFAPDSDPRVVVQRIAELNGLDGLTADTGQSLVVPMGRE